jgi:hypothetical protein
MDATEAPIAIVEPRWDIGALAGASLPVASSEHGARTSDTSHGVASLALDGTYRFTHAFGAGATLRYGASIPTLCGSTSECIGSLGNDLTLVVRARLFLPLVGRAEPYVDLGVGWEWLTTTLEDSGARSSRSYDGPVLLFAEAALPFPVGRHFTFGPVLGTTIGTFTHRRVETPAFTRDERVDTRAVHLWPTLSARLSIRF